MKSPLLAAVVEVTDRLPSAAREELARGAARVSDASAAGSLVQTVPQEDFRRAAEALVAAWRLEPEVTGREVGAMLRGAAAARTSEEREGRVEVVMTGPSQPDAPTRSTEAVVVDVVGKATKELLLVTFAAFRYQPLVQALEAAGARGVQTRAVVETMAGAQGMLGAEPAAAFSGVSGVRLFHWPLERRTGNYPGRLHAKVVVADRAIAFVTSANLTGSALESNLECGLLVHGGSAPRRIADHIDALLREGVLRPL
jgi:phosphatidylserine/phosphatidylglycerophosphate/cardiolipin synthase-like enzyme